MSKDDSAMIVSGIDNTNFQNKFYAGYSNSFISIFKAEVSSEC